MRYEDLYVAGVGSYLPKAIAVDEAIEAGRFDLEEQESTGQQTVTVAGPDDTQPEMAVRAGRVALERCGHAPDDFGLLLHAVTSHNGLDGWNAAAYVQQNVLGGAGISFEIRQLSNGAMSSVGLAAAHLAAGKGPTAAMITAADRFDEPQWDRWRSSWGLVFADGASSLVLSSTQGFARVASAVTVTDTELEVLHRGSLPFTSAPDPQLYPIDFRARTLDSSRMLDFEEAGRRIVKGMQEAVSGAADEAGIGVTEADHYVVPNFGRELLHKECVDLLGIDVRRTTWSWGTQVGHLGAADQFAGLAYLTEAGRLAPGDKVMMIGVGGGFTWTCIVLDVIDEPAWA